MITKLAVILSAVQVRRPLKRLVQFPRKPRRAVSAAANVNPMKSARPLAASRHPLTCTWRPDPVSGRLYSVWTADRAENAEDTGPSRRLFTFWRHPERRGLPPRLLAA